MRSTDRDVPPYVAVIVIRNSPPVSRVPMVNEAVVAPAATVTFAGIVVVTPGSLLSIVTTAPPEGAGPLSVTVAFTDPPPGTLVLSRPMDNNVAAAGGAVTVTDAV